MLGKSNTGGGTKWGQITGTLSEQTDLKNALDDKSSVSVSSTGTSTDEVQYITIDGVEKKLAGGGGGSGIVVTSITLQAANWVNSTYPLNGIYPAADYDIFIEPSSTATYNQIMAWADAFVASSSASNDLVAKGAVPTVDIPVVVRSFPHGSAASTETTMYAANWSNGQYSFESEYPFANYDIYIVPASTATSEQIGIFATAFITSSTTANIAIAKNIVPTVDLPVMIRVVAKNA